MKRSKFEEKRNRTIIAEFYTADLGLVLRNTAVPTGVIELRPARGLHVTHEITIMTGSRGSGMPALYLHKREQVIDETSANYLIELKSLSYFSFLCHFTSHFALGKFSFIRNFQVWSGRY